ncbi:SH3 domain-containing protein [Extensimonas vulgaris]|nr:SH3 domain-containing protein [Extensimonas vulgaris]
MPQRQIYQAQLALILKAKGFAMKKFTMGAVLAAALAVPAWAQAQTAYLSATVNLRAGPGQVYPVVAVLGSGLAINVQGCLSDYSWCDVVAGPYRGWVYGGYITYPYQGTYVPVPDYGPVIGIGIVSFTLGAYWYDHYRDRPWYAERHRWEHGPIHDGHRPPPPPPYRPSPGYQPPRFHPPRNPPPPGPGQYRTQPPEPQARPGAEGPQRFPEGPRHDPGAMRPPRGEPRGEPHGEGPRPDRGSPRFGERGH